MFIRIDSELCNNCQLKHDMGIRVSERGLIHGGIIKTRRADIGNCSRYIVN